MLKIKKIITVCDGCLKEIIEKGISIVGKDFIINKEGSSVKSTQLDFCDSACIKKYFDDLGKSTEV